MTRQRTYSVVLFALAAIAFTASGFATVGGQTPPAAQTPGAQQADSTPPPVGAESGTPSDSADADDGAANSQEGGDEQDAQQATRRLLSAQIVLVALVLAALPVGAWINASKK